MLNSALGDANHGVLKMRVSKRVVLTSLAGAAAGFSTVAIAQMSQKKSQHLAKLDTDEFMRVNQRTGSVQKSQARVSASMHEADMSAGTRELTQTSAITQRTTHVCVFETAV